MEYVRIAINIVNIIYIVIVVHRFYVLMWLFCISTFKGVVNG